MATIVNLSIKMLAKARKVDGYENMSGQQLDSIFQGRRKVVDFEGAR